MVVVASRVTVRPAGMMMLVSAPGTPFDHVAPLLRVPSVRAVVSKKRMLTRLLALRPTAVMRLFSSIKFLREST